MLHIFAQEVERNYFAAVSNVVIPAEWVEACIGAEHKIRYYDSLGVLRVGIPPQMFEVDPIGALDVADGGADKNSFARRHWIMLRNVSEWGERDTGVTTRRVVAEMKRWPRGTVYYDSIGVGSGVKTEYNNLIDRKLVSRETLPFVPWNAGGPVVDPEYHIIPDDEDSIKNGQMFQNVKAQAWWSLRTRCYKTFKNVTEGEIYPLDDLICIDAKIADLHTLRKQLSQATYGPSQNLKTMIEKQPDGTRSPNEADAVVMAFFPVEDKTYAQTGTYGGA